MKEDWRNFRNVWNTEANRLTQEGLGSKLGYDKTYIGPLGKGNKDFNERILEKFSSHMNLPLSVLFTETASKIPTKEKEEMNKIREMVAVMLIIPDIYDIMIGEFKKLKFAHASEIEQKKMPKVLCRLLE